MSEEAESSINKVVLPGDDVTEFIRSHIRQQDKVRLGTGLEVQQDSIVATLNGVLRYKTNHKHYWVETSKRRYQPYLQDQVVGVIEERGGEYYVVNIFNGAGTVLLNRLAFEGATKRNRPELKKGDVIYARVSVVGGLQGDTEVSCQAGSSGIAIGLSGQKEWTTGETVYGALSPGLLFLVSIGLSRRLLRPDCAVLHALGRYFPFEIAIGVNGAVWLRGGPSLSPEHVVIIRKMILESEYLSDEEILQYVPILVKNASSMPVIISTPAAAASTVERETLPQKVVGGNSSQQQRPNNNNNSSSRKGGGKGGGGSSGNKQQR